MVKLRPLGVRAKSKLANTPVRNCSTKCFFFTNGGKGCQYYIQEDVVHGDLCMYDLVRMKEYADAFEHGDTEVVKKDASKITAMLIMQIENMLQQVNAEGATVSEPIQDARGQVIYIPDPDWDSNSGTERTMIPAMRMHDHPLIARSIQLAKSIGVNLTEFKLTPKSADEKLQVSGHTIVGNQIDMTVIMEKRAETEARFLEAVSKGNELTLEDPVYMKLLEDEEIIN